MIYKCECVSVNYCFYTHVKTNWQSCANHYYTQARTYHCSHVAREPPLLAHVFYVRMFWGCVPFLTRCARSPQCGPRDHTRAWIGRAEPHASSIRDECVLIEWRRGSGRLSLTAASRCTWSSTMSCLAKPVQDTLKNTHFHACISCYT